MTPNSSPPNDKRDAHGTACSTDAFENERRAWLTRSLSLASVCLFPAFSACNSSPESMDKLTIAHAYQASFGLLYIADLAGLFKAEGLEIQFKRFGSGRDALAATLDGTADIATPFDTPVALALLNDEPIRVLSSLSVLQGNVQVLGNRLRGISIPADLKGHHIGYIPNTSAEYILSNLLFNSDINEHQVVLQPMDSPDELAQAMIRGDLDSAALWAPFTYQISEKMGPDAVVKFSNPIYKETALLTTTAITLEKNRLAIKKMMKGLIKAQALALSDPELALMYIQKSLPDTQPQVVAITWESMQPQIRMDNQLQTSLQNQIIWFKKTRHLDLDYNEDIRLQLSGEILQSIQPQAVTLNQLR